MTRFSAAAFAVAIFALFSFAFFNYSQARLSNSFSSSATSTFEELILNPDSGTFDLGRLYLNATGNISTSGTLRFTSTNNQFLEVARNFQSSTLRASAGPIQFVSASSSFRFVGSNPLYNTTTLIASSTGLSGVELIMEDVDGAGCTRIYTNDGALISEMAPTSTCQGVTSTFP